VIVGSKLMTIGKTTNPASKPFNPADLLRDDAGIAEFILAMLEDGDERMIPATLRTVADAVGMSELARRTGLDRSNLYSALSDDGNPRLDTMAAVARVFGLRVTPAPVKRPLKRAQKRKAVQKKRVGALRRRS